MGETIVHFFNILKLLKELQLCILLVILLIKMNNRTYKHFRVKYRYKKIKILFKDKEKLFTL